MAWVGLHEGTGKVVPCGGVSTGLSVDDDGLVENVVGEGLAGAVHGVVVLFERRLDLGILAIRFLDARVDLATDFVDGVDGGLGEVTGLLIDDGLVDLEAAEHGAEGCSIASGELGGSEGEVREIHEAGARIWRPLAEGALELEGLAARGSPGEEGAAHAAAGGEGLHLPDLHGRDGGSARLRGLPVD